MLYHMDVEDEYHAHPVWEQTKIGLQMKIHKWPLHWKENDLGTN